MNFEIEFENERVQSELELALLNSSLLAPTFERTSEYPNVNDIEIMGEDKLALEFTNNISAYEENFK